MGDSNQIRHAPDDLLPHVRISNFWVIENDDFKDEKDISDLIARIYDYPEGAFYFFKQSDGVTNKFLQGAIDSGVVVIHEYELNYYRHPKFRRDYVHLEKGRLLWDWEREVVAQCPMFVRFELKLTTRARRALEHQQLIAAQKRADRNPVELKPNFMGLGIDVYKAFAWLRSVFRESRK